MSEVYSDYSSESEEVDHSEELVLANNPNVMIMHDPGSAFLNPNPLKVQLIEMGFSSDDVDQVLVRIEGLQEAIEALLNPRRQPEISSQCLVCGEDLGEEAVVVPDCQHAFCKSCISAYVELKIREGQVLRFNCPHHECTNELTNEQVEVDLNEELIQKLALFKRNEELSRNQNLRWCPRPDCQGYDIGSLRKTTLKCNTCTYEYCYYCTEPPHGKKKCKQEADKELDRWSRKNGVKYCPNCKRRVMKSAGCNHMTCPRCQYQWCWLCGEKFHSFHFEQCSVLIAKTNNPPWYIVLGLLLAPLLIPFALPILIFASIMQNFPESSDNCINSFIRKKWLSFPLIFFTSVMLSPPIVAITLSISGPVFLFEIRDEILSGNPNAKCCKVGCLWAVVFIVFGLVLSPVLICLIVFASVVAQFFGMGLVLFKVLLCCSCCVKLPSNSSAYANY